jgi:hypothetical protein
MLGGAAYLLDVLGQRMRPGERKYAQDNAAEYEQYLANKTDEKISPVAGDPG